MKLRLGFVANSSTGDYILPGEMYDEDELSVSNLDFDELEDKHTPRGRAKLSEEPQQEFSFIGKEILI